MKKTLLALTVLASAAGVAQAQSAITIYGKVDLGIAKLTGDTTPLGVSNVGQTQANHPSRIGFMGTEDLGGGLSALLQIEGRFHADTGAQAEDALFSGPVFVGLAGRFGTLKLGRNWSTIDNASAAAIDPFEGDGMGGLNTVTRQRISNTITYYSPEISGLGVQAQYILGEKPATIAAAQQNDGYAVGIGYNNGPIFLGAGYGREENTHNSNIWSVSGAYVFGPAKIALGYDQRKNKEFAGMPKTKNTVVAITYETVAGLIKAGYSHTTEGVDNTPTGVAGSHEKIQKMAIGYQHNLSQRTSLYADVARTRYTAAGDSASVTGFGAGITHNF